VNERALRLFGPRLPRLAGAGWMPWLTLRRYDPRPLPGDAWVRVRPTLAGICGTDLALLTGRASSAMSPFASFPAVLGHEAVGTVVERGPAVTEVLEGQRVVVDPVIGCHVRGLDPCGECADGHPATCVRVVDGSLAPGLIIGYCRDLPGAWGDEMLVHRSQLHPVPDAVSEEEAVLVEPLSVALHAVLAHRPSGDARVLVIGGGTLGLLVIAALRWLGTETPIACLARHARQAAWAQRLGADTVPDEAGAAAVSGARSYRNLAGGRSYLGGPDLIYDCVGSRSSVDLALRLAGPRGTVVNVGGPAVLGSLDLTPSWVRELTVAGAYVYGREASLPGAPHTFGVALELVATGRFPLGELVTHRYRLEDWRQAMAANLDRGASGAMKTVFDLAT
jgi:threonine dehydrogenase-like Zn-dependent dehydrogenase